MHGDSKGNGGRDGDRDDARDVCVSSSSPSSTSSKPPLFPHRSHTRGAKNVRSGVFRARSRSASAGRVLGVRYAGTVLRGRRAMRMGGGRRDSLLVVVWRREA